MSAVSREISEFRISKCCYSPCAALFVASSAGTALSMAGIPANALEQLLYGSRAHNEIRTLELEFGDTYGDNRTQRAL